MGFRVSGKGMQHYFILITYTSDYHSAEELYQNDRDFDAAMMNFIVIGEEVGKLTDELKLMNEQLKNPPSKKVDLKELL